MINYTAGSDHTIANAGKMTDYYAYTKPFQGWMNMKPQTLFKE
jgi:hypothetical protein